jgi:hypothetical protein
MMKILKYAYLAGLCLAVLQVNAQKIQTGQTGHGKFPAVKPAVLESIRENRIAGSDEKQCRRILSNAIRYNLDWIIRSFKKDERHNAYIIEEYGEHGVRPAASVCYAAAVALKCAEMNESELGISPNVARERIKCLIKGVASAYKKNRTDGNGWGYVWQSAHWATLVGQGAWILWDELDKETQEFVQTMIVEEANRFVATDYTVPYWISPDGKVNSPGDTKAEENAWNAGILMVAVAMMPNHPLAEQWKQVCSELTVSAFALKKDLDNNSIADGKPVKEWLHGYNVRDDGMVENHGRIHPDYTSAITLNTRTYLIQPFAAQPVFEGADMTLSFIYRTFMEYKWQSPPYSEPGGTIYMPDKVDIYYPQGNDWSYYRFDIYYLLDVNAYFSDSGPDKSVKEKALQWLRLRANRIEAMQTRHSNGKMYAPGEFDSYPGCEQMAAWQLADAYLFFRLYMTNTIINE